MVRFLNYRDEAWKVSELILNNSLQQASLLPMAVSGEQNSTSQE
jgi:hypothetical protein